MTNELFAERMKQILEKAGKASGMCLTWHVISTDPDCVADFGCDADGHLVIMEDSFPLKIADLSNIRYRWNDETDSSDCYIRFDFGKDTYLDCCFSDCDMGHMFHVKYHDTYETCLNKEKAIALLKELKNKNDMIKREAFLRSFNDAVEEFNDTVANIMLAIEADYDPYFEYRSIEVALDGDSLVIGGKKTTITIYDVEDIRCQFNTYSPDGQTIWNYFGSCIVIKLSNGKDIKLVYVSEYDECMHLRDDDGLYVEGSFVSFETVEKNTEYYSTGMTREIFINEYNTVVEKFNERSGEFLEGLYDDQDYDDEDSFFELAIDDDDRLRVMNHKTKISVSDVAKICYRCHSQEDESIVRFILTNGKSFIICCCGGNAQEVNYMPDEDFYY